MQATVRPIAPLTVSFPAAEADGEGEGADSLAAMLGGRPLVCLSFEDMHVSLAGRSGGSRIFTCIK